MPGRSLGIESVPNLRDLGGYETVDGATVAGGLVYRSDQYGTIEKYFSEGLGIDAARQKALRDLYLGQE